MKNHKKLRIALMANATFSFLAGLDLVIFNKTISGWMNINKEIILPIIGIALLFFASFVFITGIRKDIHPKVVQFIIIQDWLWVIGSAILLVFRPFGVSTTGNIIIAIVALFVSGFAIAQKRGLNEMNLTLQ